MEIRRALGKDIADIVSLLADDELGTKREDNSNPLPESYYEAFKNIDRDENQWLIVAEEEGEIIGTAQLSLIPYMTYQGGIRCQIEAVRIKSSKRGSGLGEELFQWMINKARECGAHLIQLTTDKQRPDTLRFYQKMGFKSTHEGMKMNI